MAVISKRSNHAKRQPVVWLMYTVAVIILLWLGYLLFQGYGTPTAMTPYTTKQMRELGVQFLDQHGGPVFTGARVKLGNTTVCIANHATAVWNPRPDGYCADADKPLLSPKNDK